MFKIDIDNAAAKLVNLYRSWQFGLPIDNYIKKGIVILFYKKDPSNPANYRPITLLNSIYKIFSLILTNRMMVYKKFMINISQKGFIKERSGLDNILITKLLMKDPNTYAALIDFAKAFDSVDHAHILRCLNLLGIPIKFINLIRSMLGGWSKILIGQHFSEKFFCARGVRQGDPISPILFAIAVEPLSRMISHKKTDTPKIHNLNIPILLYADDIIIFANNENKLLNQIKVIHQFQQYSGLQLNPTKCDILASQENLLKLNLSNTIASNFNLKSSTTYLGVVISIPESTEIPKAVWDKFVNTLNKWTHIIKNSSMTAPGRASIIQGYVISTLIHHLWFHTPSEKQIQYYNSNLSRLMSRNNIPHRKELWLASRKFGGIEFYPLETQLLTQQAWWIMRWNNHTSTNDYKPEWMNVFYYLHKSNNYPFIKQWMESYNTLEKISGFKAYLDLKSDYLKWNKHCLNKPTLITSSAMNLLKITSPTSLFCTINQLKVRKRIKSFLWELFQSKLPIKKSLSCPLCGNDTSGNHLIRCSTISEYIEQFTTLYNRTRPLDNFSLKHPLHFSPDNFEFNNHLAIFLWACYRTFNNYTHNNSSDLDPLSYLINTYNYELTCLKDTLTFYSKKFFLFKITHYT